VAPRTVSAAMAGRAERDDPARVEISIGAPGFEPGTSSPPDPGSGWPSVAVSACSTTDATFGGCARRRIRPWVAACSFQRGSKTAPPDDSLEDADNLPAPEVIAQEIIEDLEATLTEFTAVAQSLAKEDEA
jgi:hypothetical protein